VAKRSDKVRMNLRIDAGLVRWLRAYARKHDTTMTELVVSGIEELKRKSGGGPPKVDQF
jgi:hypothetical protein